MNFDEKMLKRLTRIEREIEKLKVWERPSTSWIVLDAKINGWSAGYTSIGKYTIIGKTCYFSFYVTGTSSGSGATIDLPATAATVGTGFGWGGVLAYAVNNGSVLTTASRWLIANGSDLLLCYPDMGTGNWTASGTKTVLATGFYETA